MTNLNTKRLTLSNELSDLVLEMDKLNKVWLDGLSMKQYNVYHTFHLKLGCITVDQLNQITRSKTLKQVALKAYVIQTKIFKVNAELDSVLDSMNARISA
jgi:hypothetical protein